VTVKARTLYRCTECGADHPKWGGRCDVCGEWNTLAEEVERPASRSKSSRLPRPAGPISVVATIGSIETTRSSRVSSGIRELDYVLGGGIVGGSVVLVGGEPGIGKSTLLLQAAASASRAGRRALYVSAEESGPTEYSTSPSNLVTNFTLSFTCPI
jgi:DNA repair protein RadA/Sms